jgi:hypothetical protein
MKVLKVATDEDMAPFGETANQRSAGERYIAVVLHLTNSGGTAVPADGYVSFLILHADDLSEGFPLAIEFSGSDHGVPIYNGGYPTALPVIQPGQALDVEAVFSGGDGTTKFLLSGYGHGLELQ